jgi:hypothetical protein
MYRVLRLEGSKEERDGFNKEYVWQINEDGQ